MVVAYKKFNSPHKSNDCIVRKLIKTSSSNDQLFIVKDEKLEIVLAICRMGYYVTFERANQW